MLSFSGAIKGAKIRPHILLPLLAGAVAIAYITLGGLLLQERFDQDSLSSEIESGEAVLATADDLSADLEDMPARLAQVRDELDAAQIAFPSELESNNVIQTVLALADENKVHVLSIHAASPPATESEEETTADASLSFNLKAEGYFGQLIVFLGALEEGETSTTRVDTFALQEASGQYTLDLVLVAFARPPTEAASPADEAESPGEGTTTISSNGEDPPSE